MNVQELWRKIREWYLGLTPGQRLFWNGLPAVIFILFVPGGRLLIGPLFMAGFWTLASTENRTVSPATLILAWGVGLLVILPAAFTLETPLVIVAQGETAWTAALGAGLEALLLGAAIAVLALWRGSRLRHTGSILDFALMGLFLGAGLECGLGVLVPEAAGHEGVSWAVLPQMPGMFGHGRLPFSCSSPATWGLVMGLMIGFARYLVGPDFDTPRARIFLPVSALLLTAWIVSERLVFISGHVSGFGRILFWIDLQGRLLTYLAGILTCVVMITEWLLMQERPLAASLRHPWRAYRRAWASRPAGGWFKGLQSLWRLAERRNHTRELILAEEIKPLLKPADQGRLEKRVVRVWELMNQEGSWRP